MSLHLKKDVSEGEAYCLSLAPVDSTTELTSTPASKRDTPPLLCETPVARMELALA